jgi:N-acetylmuramoyl-L-alanine amidase
MLASLLSYSVPVIASEDPLRSAQRYEAALRSDEPRLKYRHNIEHLIALWSEARTRTKGPDRVAALEGEARAKKLLAHWSGRSDDQEKAVEASRQVDREKKKDTPDKPKPKPARAAAKLASASIEEGDNGLALVLAVQGELSIERSIIPKKTDRGAKLYFNLRPVHAARLALKTIAVGRESIDRVRVGQFDDDTVRVVIDGVPSRPEALEMSRDGDVLRLVLAERGPARAPEAAKSDVLLQIVKEMKRALPDEEIEPQPPEPSEPPKEIAEAEPPSETPDIPPAIEPETHDVALQRSTREALKPRDSSVLCIHRIVIDAGHGGKDFGAQGVHGVREKDVNLQIAMKLGRELKKRLGVQVIYTRSADEFVSLRRRTQIANRSNADLFVSVHANAHKKRSVSGIETYFLNTTSDHYADRLAWFENTGAEKEGDADAEPSVGMQDADEKGLPSGALGRDLRLLLAELAMRSASTESKRLAGYVQSALVGALSKKNVEARDLGVKHALFYVLLGARMPSVLVETGFVTNPSEGQRLADPQYQTEVASAVASGIARFSEERAALAKREIDREALVALRGR